MTLDFFIALALSLPATVYGLGERRCGQKMPLPCAAGATTSSGQAFDPRMFIAAVPAPDKLRVRPRFIFLKAHDGACIPVKLVDRKNARLAGKSGLDLSPALVERLTGRKPSATWSGLLEPCSSAPLPGTGATKQGAVKARRSSK